MICNMKLVIILAICCAASAFTRLANSMKQRSSLVVVNQVAQCVKIISRTSVITSILVLIN